MKEKRRWISTIKKVLAEHFATRDSDPILYETVIRELGFDPKLKSACDLIDAVALERIPSWDYVSRARRLLQHEEAGLRGHAFELRHRKADEFRFAPRQEIYGTKEEARKELRP